MARLYRLCGALLLETVCPESVDYFLLGYTKVPCDFVTEGFEKPAEERASYQKLRVQGPVKQPRGTCLLLSLEGEPCARLVTERLLIARNGSVSERLWRLITDEDEDAPASELTRELDARWLVEVPQAVWDVVRDTVLRCS